MQNLLCNFGVLFSYLVFFLHRKFQCALFIIAFAVIIFTLYSLAIADMNNADVQLQDIRMFWYDIIQKNLIIGKNSKWNKIRKVIFPCTLTFNIKIINSIVCFSSLMFFVNMFIFHVLEDGLKS